MREIIFIVSLAAFTVVAALAVARKSEPHTFSYHVAWTAPIVGGTADGYSVISYTQPVTTADGVLKAVDFIKPTITNLAGNVIITSFTYLPDRQ